MLPRATRTRTSRERSQVGGRTQEIQRLIGRSVRAMLDDFRVRRVHACKLDCDVLQADGGTRTAAITGRLRRGRRRVRLDGAHRASSRRRRCGAASRR